MAEDDRIVEENWIDADWESHVKGRANDQSKDQAVPDEKLVREVLDAEQRAARQDADRRAEEELQQHDVPLPPPTLTALASGLAAQAMVSMGVLPNPVTGKSVMLLHQAAHLIDTIDMLLEKTEGNRTEEETQTLENMLHELRMIYLAAEKEKQRRRQDDIN